jgi:hypothetical protein
MASLDTTERAKVALAAGESLIVTTNGQCTVQGLSGAPETITTLTANTQTFGPYGVSAVLLVTNVGGRTEYSANNATYTLSAAEKSAFDTLASDTGIEAFESIRWADQFGVDESPALPVEPVTASATGIAIAGACAIASIYCVTVGTGTLTVHDDYSASDATKLRFSRADSAMAAAGVYPMVSDAAGTAMLFDTGAFVTVPSGGIYVLDVVRPGSAIRGVRGSGLLCVPRRVAASGLAVEGICNVASLKVIAPGSSGNLAVYDDRVATNANRLRYPVTAFGSLTADQIITFGRNPRRFGNINITVPTGGIVLVNTLVR